MEIWDAMTRYHKEIEKTYAAILNEEKERLMEACQQIAEAIQQRDIFHIIGTGAHGSMAAEEMLWRVGGLACANAILDPNVNLLFGANYSGIMDQTDCNCGAVLDANGVRPGDLLIIVNSSGINRYSTTLAKLCRERGIKTIAITSRFGLMLPEPRKENLFQLADLYIDNHMPYGDAAVQLEGYDQKVGPVSSLLKLFIVNLLVCGTIELLRQKGVEPPVWKYDACPGGEEFNQSLHERYRSKIVHL